MRAYLKILEQPTRQAIVRSILTREDASSIAEIGQDVPRDQSTLHVHIDKLLEAGILMKDEDVRDTQHRGTLVYFISYEDERLQGVLRMLFPDLMPIN
jgi:predicted transcriptional regulator